MIFVYLEVLLSISRSASGKRGMLSTASLDCRDDIQRIYFGYAGKQSHQSMFLLTAALQDVHLTLY